MIQQRPFDENNVAIPHARQVVREQINAIAQLGQLQAAALNQKSVVAHLAMGPLSHDVIQGVITIQMLERWVMEAISAAAKQRGQEGAYVILPLFWQCL
jgi:hypothetical protein